MDSREIETAICTRLVDDIVAAGHTVSVNDGEAWAIKRSNDSDAILAAMFSTDSDMLLVRTAKGDQLGRIALVYGNGTDVICDYTCTDTITQPLGGASALADSYAEANAILERLDVLNHRLANLRPRALSDEQRQCQHRDDGRGCCIDCETFLPQT
jgi:hypothetical protein